MRIAIAWELGHGSGHIARLLSIARALKDQGAVLSFICRASGDLSPESAAIFDKVVAAPISFAEAQPGKILSLAQIVAASAFSSAEHAFALVRAWSDTFSLLRPDLLICDHSPTALLAAHVNKIAAARVGTAFTTPVGQGLDNLRPWQRLSLEEKSVADASVDKIIGSVLGRYGFDQDLCFADLTLKYKGFLTTWPYTDHLGPRSGVPYFGPLSTLSDTRKVDYVGSGKKVLVYLPNRTELGRKLFQALRDTAASVIWRGSVEENSGRIKMVDYPIDMNFALHDADLLISRAGHGITCQALAAGKAHLMLPVHLEGSLLAFWATRQGYASASHETASINDLIEKIAHCVSDVSMQRTCGNISRCLSEYSAEAATQTLVSRILAI